jgi:vacuolar-type H+-ATPase subunit H
VERGNSKWERESAEVIAEAKSKAEQEAGEIIAAAKQTAKQIVFQAFQRSLGTLLDKGEVAQEDEEIGGGQQTGEDT